MAWISIKKFFIGIILFLVALLLLIPLSIWGVIEILIGLFWKRHFFKSLGVLGEFIILLAVVIDVTGNVLMQYPLNRILTTDDGYRFGSRYDTISFVLGMNKINGTLTKNGELLCNILDRLDKDHCINTVKNKKLV